MYLQLAEGGGKKIVRRRFLRDDYGGFDEYGGFSEAKVEQTPYIFVPDPSGQSKGVFIREDHFDFMTDFEWRKLMADLAPFQPEVANQTMSEGAFLADRASRKARRAKREASRAQRKEDKHQKRDAKNALKRARAQAKAEGRGSDILGGVIDGVKNIFGKKTDDGSDGGDGGAPTPNTPAPTPDKTDKPFYENPVVIVAGVGILAGGIYAFTNH